MRDSRALAAVFAAALFASGIWAYWSLAAEKRMNEKLRAEVVSLRIRSDGLAKELDAVRRGQPASPPLPSAERERREPPAGASENIDAARLLIQFREKLAAANASAHGLESRIRELDAGIENLKEENKRLAGSEAALKETLAATNRVLEAVRNELKSKDDRLTQVMVTNNQLLEENRRNADRLAQLPRLVRDVEELNRRREGYVSNILRRYRDITEQYRALAGRLEHPGDAAAGAPSELARIQNAITMSEEDLRQLSALDAQAARLQQRISGK